MQHHFFQGTQNLLFNCGGLKVGEKLLIVSEEPIHDYYDPTLAHKVGEVAQSLGLKVEHIEVPFNPNVTAPSAHLQHAMQLADRTLFLARLGDQLRFSESLSSSRAIVCYALDCEMLASNFGKLDHHLMVQLKYAINDALSKAKKIEVTCPLGTQFSGPGAKFSETHGEVTVDRFPLSVFTPIPAAPYSGKIAQAGFLTGTGSNYYTPYTLPLRDLLFIHFENSRIIGLEGHADDVKGAQQHYRDVGERFDIEHDFVHSWHAGIHPGCGYRLEAGTNTERWGGGAFGNPRILHFHTCGNYAPGEISINVIDPTVKVDGIALWDNGVLFPERSEKGRQLLSRDAILKAAFDNAARDIGLSANGRLSVG